MNPFQYQRPAAVAQALHALAEFSPANHEGERWVSARGMPKVLAGGTNLLDLMKEGLARPATLVDVRQLPLRGIATLPDGRLRLGALESNAHTAQHPLVREGYPVLRAAILAGASPQIRNMATNGGNLLQRTRCSYFYDASVPCNKHRPGSGCPARTGVARQHAILGASAQCVATHPSDLCVALAALDAVVHVESVRGVREIPFAEFHRLPGEQPERDTTLDADELITHLTLPNAGRFASHACYLKLRERASYAFALVSVAALLDLDENRIVRDARLALGGVAHKPWRDRTVESLLIGRPADEVSFGAAADLLLREARATGGAALPEGQQGNAFKIPLARRAIIRALQMAREGELTNTGEDASHLEVRP
jgi:xanthine dehydrogenase YagS FAD-binding subunit